MLTYCFLFHSVKMRHNIQTVRALREGYLSIATVYNYYNAIR